MSNNESEESVSIIVLLLPADDSLPPREVVMETQKLDEFISFMEESFRLKEGETVNLKLLQEQANQARDCSTGMCPHVSPITLQRAAEEGTLQQAKLSKDGDESIYLYWDESANLKDRPLNTRATKLLRNSVGGVDEHIHGGAFLARIRNQQVTSLRVSEISRESWFTDVTS